MGLDHMEHNIDAIVYGEYGDYGLNKEEFEAKKLNDSKLLEPSDLENDETVATEVDTEPEVTVNTEPELETEPEVAAEPEAEVETEPEVAVNPEPEVETEPEIAAKTEPEVDESEPDDDYEIIETTTHASTSTESSTASSTTTTSEPVEDEALTDDEEIELEMSEEDIDQFQRVFDDEDDEKLENEPDKPVESEPEETDSRYDELSEDGDRKEFNNSNLISKFNNCS